MPTPVVIVLVALWVLGVATSHTLGGFVHVLLGLAVALLVVRFVQKRRSNKEQTAVRERRRQLMRRSTGERL